MAGTLGVAPHPPHPRQRSNHLTRPWSFEVSSALGPGRPSDDYPQLHRLGRWPTNMLDMLTETPVLADLAMKNVLTLLTGYLQ